MKSAILALLLMSTPVVAEELVYEGPWYTGITEDGKPTGRRKLEGIMTAVVTPVGKGQWQGRFYGVWHGVKFDYNVKFTGNAKKLRGKAIIDGASYDWKAVIGQQSPGWFSGTFTGSRYDGYFKLKEKAKAKAR